MTRHQAMMASSVALALGLGGCGGGGGGVNSTPPPSVTPPPPPPPPASAALAPFPNGSIPTFYTTSHASAVGEVRVERLDGGKARLTGVERLSTIGSGGIGTFEYRGPNNYAVEFGGFGGPAFASGDQATSTTAFDVFRTSEQGSFANLELARAATGVALTYASFGNVVEFFDQSSKAQITFFAAGSQTPRAQVPTTGSANFAGIADGLWTDGTTTRRLYGSPATLTADFGTGIVTSRLELRGHDDPFGNFLAAPTTALGTFTGTGAITSGGPLFSGTYAPSAGYAGGYGGTFFGPAAGEFGLSFALTGSPGQAAIGSAVGKKQ